MKEIANRVWREPAVAIGLITTIALAVLAVVTGTNWDASVIVGIVAPVVSALGIRTQVTPVTGQHETPAPGPPGSELGG